MRLSLKKLCLSALVLAALTVPASAQAQGKSATLHQVAAGVSEYAPGTQPNLKWAHKDAQDVAAFWQQHGPQMFGKVSGGALVNQQATRQNILARLDEVVADAQPGDWAVIFLAGHGGPKGFEWQFCTHDGTISATELQQRIAKLADKKVTVVLIIDSCFSGDIAVPATRALVLAACHSGQFSGESDALQNGYFTHALLEALHGKAHANQNGHITLAAVRVYMTEQARSFGGQQTPLFSVPAGMDDNLSLVVVGGSGGTAGNWSHHSHVKF
jgi:uncharacterized caspase-like protein